MKLCRSILSILLLLPLTTQGQHVSITPLQRSDFLYLCIGGSFKFAYHNCKPNEIFVTTDNGTMDTIFERYTLRPAQAGRATIYAHLKKGGRDEVVDSFSYAVKRIPPRSARLGKYKGGKVPAAEIRTQYSIFVPARFDASVYCVEPRGTVKRFTVTGYRDNAQIFRHVCGDQFDEDTKNFFYGLRKGDRIVFSNIVQRDCDGADIWLPEFEVIAD